MDPNENLQQQLELAASLIRAADAGESVDEADAVRLAELVQSLNQWIAHSGFLPEQWTNGQGRGQSTRP